MRKHCLDIWDFLTFDIFDQEAGSGGPRNPGGPVPRGTRGRDTPTQPTGCFGRQLEPLIGKPNWGKNHGCQVLGQQHLSIPKHDMINDVVWHHFY